MANREACELYIEQQIKEGLAEGKKGYSIGMEIAGWIEQRLGVTIKPATITKRAQRIEAKRNRTNVPKELNPPKLEVVPELEPGDIAAPVAEDCAPVGGG